MTMILNIFSFIGMTIFGIVELISMIFWKVVSAAFWVGVFLTLIIGGIGFSIFWLLRMFGIW